MNIKLLQCPPDKRREALLHLAAVYDPALQSALQSALAGTTKAAVVNWQGLWIAQQAERIVSAVWVQPQAHHTAQLWLPKALDSTGMALINTARHWSMQQRFKLCHTLLSAAQHDWQQPLLAQGMQSIASLEHLSRPCQPCSPSLPITLAPWSTLSFEQQHGLLAGVSHASSDCPALLQLLTIEELLANFYANAPLAPQHWYHVNYQQQSVGILLLVPTGQRCELLLMGLLPEWRGKGLGNALMEKAFLTSAQAGARELVLTVDANNTPAKRLYERNGFSCYAQHYLFAWPCRAHH